MLPHSNWRHSASAHDFASKRSCCVRMRTLPPRMRHKGDNKPSFFASFKSYGNCFPMTVKTSQDDDVNIATFVNCDDCDKDFC